MSVAAADCGVGAVGRVGFTVRAGAPAGDGLVDADRTRIRFTATDGRVSAVGTVHITGVDAAPEGEGLVDADGTRM